MPYFISQAEFDSTGQAALNAAAAKKLVEELKLAVPYDSGFSDLLVFWAANKKLCLNQALAESEFKAELVSHFNTYFAKLPPPRIITIKRFIAESRHQLLVDEFLKLDNVLTRLPKEEKQPAKKATNVSKLAAGLKSALPMTAPTVSASSPSLAGILTHKGYWEANRAFYPRDLDRALRGYVDDVATTVATTHKHASGDITVINGSKILWRDDSDVPSLASRKIRMDQTLELIKAVRKALKDGSKKIFITINNGSGHFVFLEIKKEVNGDVKLTLKDSMDPDAHNVSPAHKRNNQDLVDILVAHIQEDLDLTGKTATGEVVYARVQGENAKCPFHAVFELAKACTGQAAFDQTDALIVAAATGSISKFEEAMAQKILNLSSEHKMTKEEVESVKVDEFGILYKSIPKTTKQYDDYRANINFQYNMGIVVYNRISDICRFLQTPPAADMKSEEVHRRSREWIQSDGSSIVAVIKRIEASTDPIPEGLPITDLLKYCRAAGISKTIAHNSKNEKICVDGVQLVGGYFNPATIAEHVLKTANTSLLVSGTEDAQITLTLDTLADIPKMEDFDKHGVAMYAHLDHIVESSEIPGLSLKNYEESGAKQIKIVLECKKQDEKAALQKLRSLIEVVPSFNPALCAVIDAQIAKLQPKKAEVKALPPKPRESDASAVFTVISSGKVAARGQIYSAPAASTAGKIKVPEFLREREAEKKAETGRKQLHHWFTDKSPPARPPKTAEEKKALPTQEAHEVLVKQLFAVEAKGVAAAGLLKDRELKQCGVIETCIEPGKATKVELILPAKTDLEKNQADFNTVLFDFVHRTVQGIIAKQGGNDPKRKQIIKLDEVFSTELRLLPAEVALIQYCQYMKSQGLNYECQTALGKPIDMVQILTDYKKPLPPDAFYTALGEFIKEQADQEAKAVPELIVSPAPRSGMI